jgi:site-specific recombinase XerD
MSFITRNWTIRAVLYRAGVDLLTIARLLGHSDMSILERYIKQTSEDLRGSHERGSPVDADKSFEFRHL